MPCVRYRVCITVCVWLVCLVACMCVPSAFVLLHRLSRDGWGVNDGLGGSIGSLGSFPLSANMGHNNSGLPYSSLVRAAEANDDTDHCWSLHTSLHGLCGCG